MGSLSVKHAWGPLISRILQRLGWLGSGEYWVPADHPRASSTWPQGQWRDPHLLPGKVCSYLSFLSPSVSVCLTISANVCLNLCSFECLFGALHCICVSVCPCICEAIFITSILYKKQISVVFKHLSTSRVSTKFRRHGIPRNFLTSEVISAQFRRNSAKFRGIPRNFAGIAPEITSVFRGMPKCHFRGHPTRSQTRNH
jgi:hypothetical protein